MTKPSPAPYVIRGSQYEKYYDLCVESSEITETTGLVAEIQLYNEQEPPTPLDLANARLLKSAPEMLSLLESYTKLLQNPVAPRASYVQALTSDTQNILNYIYTGE